MPPDEAVEERVEERVGGRFGDVALGFVNGTRGICCPEAVAAGGIEVRSVCVRVGAGAGPLEAGAVAGLEGEAKS